MPDMTDERFREKARDEYQADDGDIEIDDNAVISRGDPGGAYVAAWVWVSFDEVSEEETA